MGVLADRKTAGQDSDRHDDPARFRLIPDSRVEGGYALLCVACGRTSYHPMDVKMRYCGNCHEFLDD